MTPAEIAANRRGILCMSGAMACFILNDVIIGTLPFVVALFVILGLLAAFPDLALWLPRVVG